MKIPYIHFTSCCKAMEKYLFNATLIIYVSMIFHFFLKECEICFFVFFQTYALPKKKKNIYNYFSSLGECLHVMWLEESIDSDM